MKNVQFKTYGGKLHAFFHTENGREHLACPVDNISTHSPLQALVGRTRTMRIDVEQMRNFAPWARVSS